MDPIYTYMGKSLMLNKNHNNAAIQVHILPDNKMREIGFTDYNPTTWYFCKYGMGGLDDISFSLSVKKNDETDWRIDVLDENFLQPYDYQAMLERNTTNPIPHKVKEDVEYWMQHLTDKGVISGHNYGEYI